MDQIEPDIISELSSSLEIDLAPNTSIDEIRVALADHINYFITHDLNKLVAILYRIDISEKLLKRNLEEEGKDAGAIIAEMIIERQIQKVKTREQFKGKDDIPGNEKW
ncbi:MAG: hypothetical protein E6H10_15095 [Bacteroidetes bacterium]|nr:MAG: hypothetical protein E6H10_15095 [Bacteroidota bacterium]